MTVFKLQIYTYFSCPNFGVYYKVAEICRKHGISDATFFNWKKKYSGMTVQELKRLKELEYENSRLKKMFADLSLENEALKDIVSKKF